jgi:hypothetical protein
MDDHSNARGISEWGIDQRAAEAIPQYWKASDNRGRAASEWKHDSPDALASGESALVAGNDETGVSCLIFLLRAQCDELAVALQHALDLLGVGFAVDFALALFCEA